MRRAFTIIELLVSIGIFVVTAALMFGALFGATEVFRKGEAARQAGDEATAVLAALQEDLARAVPIRLRDGEPARDWGHIRAEVMGQEGNCQLTMVIENPDRSQVRWVGTGANRAVVGVRKRVTWGVVQPAGGDGPASGQLVREEIDLAEDGQPAAGGLARTSVVCNGVLHFGVWMTVPSVAGMHGSFFRPMNQGQPDWEAKDTASPPDSVLPPWKGEPFDTLPPGYTSGAPFWNAPECLRLSLVLTGGGRYATRGTLVRDISDADLTARISGIKALPTTSGSLLRIEDEWVRYDDFRNGQITIRSDGRGALRSTAQAHSGRVTVLAGQPFSLVVALPR